MVRLRHSFAASLLAQSKFQYTTLATWEYLPEWRNDLLQCCDLLSYLHFRHLLLHLIFFISNHHFVALNWHAKWKRFSKLIWYRGSHLCCYLGRRWFRALLLRLLHGARWPLLGRPLLPVTRRYAAAAATPCRLQETHAKTVHYFCKRIWIAVR